MKRQFTRSKLFLLLPILLLAECSNPTTQEEADVASIDTTGFKIKFYDDNKSKVDIGTTTALVDHSIDGANNRSNKFLTNGDNSSTLFFAMGDFPVGGVESKQVSTSDLIKEIFNKTGIECLGGNDPAKKKIRGFAENKVPENLTIHSQDATMNYYEGVPGLLILSTFKVIRANGTEEFYSLPSGRVGVSSILDLINPGDANSYIYQMDCSGYFTFALSIATGRPKLAELNAAANASAKGSKSSIVAYGKFASPLAIAMKPGASFNLEFDNPTRKLVLQNILNAPSSLGNTDKVVVNNYSYLLITSTSGSSGFTGKFDLNASAGGTIGIIRGSVSTSGGSTYSRSVRFTDYNTYVSTRLDNSATNETQMTVSEIKSALAAIPN
jgi:hypothetical protein